MDEFNNNPIQGNNDNNNDPIQRSGESNQGQNYNNYTQNVNTQPKKKSKAPVIIGIICAVLLVGCLVIGGIFAVIFGLIPFLTNRKISQFVNEVNSFNYTINTNEMGSIVNDIRNTTNSIKNTTNAINKINTNSTLNDLKNIVGNVNNTTTNSTVANNSKLDVKTSTQSNPIKKGEWGAASKYDAKTKDYQEAYVKVTNFIRGEDATKLVKEYTDSSSYYTYTEPKEGMEYVVVEYEVDFSNFEIPSYGISVDLSPSAKGTKDGSSAITYNGVNYYTTATSINKSSESYVKTAKGKGKFAVQIPKGCTDYVVSFGAYGKTITYIKGE